MCVDRFFMCRNSGEFFVLGTCTHTSKAHIQILVNTFSFHSQCKYTLLQSKAFCSDREICERDFPSLPCVFCFFFLAFRFSLRFQLSPFFLLLIRIYLKIKSDICMKKYHRNNNYGLLWMFNIHGTYVKERVNKIVSFIASIYQNGAFFSFVLETCSFQGSFRFY